MADAARLLAQIEDVMQGVYQAKNASQHDDYSGGLPNDQLCAISVRLRATISRLSQKDSVYYKLAQEVSGSSAHEVRDLGAILSALREDIKAGYVESLSEIVHAEVYTDFLEMAQELQHKGYKDPAAVVAGSVLEGQLRKLALKVGVSTAKSDGAPKKADSLNNELATAAVYNASQQKSVLAWLALRNDAAHGNYTAYDHKQVAGLIRDVQDFITRYPA